MKGEKRVKKFLICTMLAVLMFFGSVAPVMAEERAKGPYEDILTTQHGVKTFDTYSGETIFEEGYTYIVSPEYVSNVLTPCCVVNISS